MGIGNSDLGFLKYPWNTNWTRFSLFKYCRTLKKWRRISGTQIHHWYIIIYFQNSKNHTGEIKYSNMANNGPLQQKKLEITFNKKSSAQGIRNLRALGLIIFWWKSISHFFFALGLNITIVRSCDYMKRTDIFYIQKWGKDIFDYRKKYFYEKKNPEPSLVVWITYHVLLKNVEYICYI